MFVQDVLTRWFELLENNFTKQDDFTEHFKKILKNKRIIEKDQEEYKRTDSQILTDSD